MNGTAMVWQTLQSDDKRSYYWNKETNTTSWVKPDELLTPAQVCVPKNINVTITNSHL